MYSGIYKSSISLYNQRKKITNNTTKTKSQLKARLKRYVFNLDLKTSTDPLNLMSKGISFQCFGAATERALSNIRYF